MIPWRFQKWIVALAGVLSAIGLVSYAIDAMLGRPVTMGAIFGGLFVLAVSVVSIVAKGWED